MVSKVRTITGRKRKNAKITHNFGNKSVKHEMVFYIDHKRVLLALSGRIQRAGRS